MDEPEILTGPLNRAETPDPTAAAGTKPVSAPNLNTILSIPVTVQVVLGSTLLPVANLMKLARGAVISLDQRVGDPVDIVVNGRVVARGEIVVVDEVSQRFGVSLVEIVSSASLEHVPEGRAAHA
jgi:flagellar motor switch protein FliN